MIQKIKIFTILAITTICALPMKGQDLLARQAPVDRKMKAVDSVALQRLIFTENFEPVILVHVGDVSTKDLISRYILATPSVQPSQVRYVSCATRLVVMVSM